MSMAKEDFCLPSEFLCDDFFLSHEDEDRRDEAGFTEACFADEFAMNLCFLREMEEEEEETYVAGLTRQMADRYVLHHGGRPPLAAFSATSPDLTRQQLMQSAQLNFHRLKQSQLMRRQLLLAAWARQSKARGRWEADCGRSPSPWRSLHKQPPPPPQPAAGNGMRAVFLKSPGGRSESAGTGVFLPRTADGNSSLPRKKPACSTVLVPERVIQALNLSPAINAVSDHDANLGRRANPMLSHPWRFD